MTLPLYLAMTAAEITPYSHTAYMACHFSPYSTGLSNLPQDLPPGCMIIINDRIPVQGHDPQIILAQLHQLCTQLRPESILLDMQRAPTTDAETVVEAICTEASCPVAVSELYASKYTCPVFLSSPPIHKTLDAHITPWKGRQIWLEAATELCSYVVTERDCALQYLPQEEPAYECPQLFCHYSIRKTDESAIITLERTRDDLIKLLATAEGSGITKAIGLYQQLNGINYLQP